MGFGKPPAWQVQRYLPLGPAHWLSQWTLVQLSVKAPFSPDSRIILETQSILSSTAPLALGLPLPFPGIRAGRLT